MPTKAKNSVDITFNIMNPDDSIITILNLKDMPVPLQLHDIESKIQEHGLHFTGDKWLSILIIQQGRGRLSITRWTLFLCI